MSEAALPSPCEKFEKGEVDHYVDAETVKTIGSNYRTLPTFEKTMFELKFIKLYSLKSNERFACFWEEYINRLRTHQAPFQFPSSRDQHFYLNAVYHKPSQSQFRKTDVRMKMASGPGVDHLGQMPIPYELHMKRGPACKGNTRKSDDKAKAANNSNEQIEKKENPKAAPNT